MRNIVKAQKIALKPFVVAIGIAAFGGIGCDGLQVSTPSACPAMLRAEPAYGLSAIEWGGSDKVSAEITAVVVECIPAHHETVATDRAKQVAFTDYELAATATVVYKIADAIFFEDATGSSNMDATLVFEALSNTGVVLGFAPSSFRVVGGGTAGTASAKILGLSDEEIRRVVSVRAKWQYGH